MPNDWPTYTALAAIVISLVSLCVSALQWRIARARLQLDYSPRRQVIYDAACAIIWRIQEKAGAIDVSDLIEFNGKTRDADFVLNQDLSKYLAQLSNRAAKVAALAYTTSDPGTDDAERAKANKEKWEEIRWFSAQRDILKSKFAPFLRLK